MDYQQMVLMKCGEVAPSVLNVAADLRDWALSKGMSVFHCLIDTTPGVQPAPRNKSSPKWKMYEDKFAARPALGREADGIAPRDPSSEVVVLRTPGLVSALESNGLLSMLAQRGIQSLILAGVTTSGCVLSTARAATDRGYVVTVVEDACFDPVPGVHAILATHVLPITAHVATSREIGDAWKIL